MSDRSIKFVIELFQNRCLKVFSKLSQSCRVALKLSQMFQVVLKCWPCSSQVVPNKINALSKGPSVVRVVLNFCFGSCIILHWHSDILGWGEGERQESNGIENAVVCCSLGNTENTQLVPRVHKFEQIHTLPWRSSLALRRPWGVLRSQRRSMKRSDNCGLCQMFRYIRLLVAPDWSACEEKIYFYFFLSQKYCLKLYKYLLLRNC